LLAVADCAVVFCAVEDAFVVFDGVFALLSHVGFTMRGAWCVCLGVGVGVLFRLRLALKCSFAWRLCLSRIFGCSGGRRFVGKAVVAGWVLFGWV
jgi:hypothetical protein